MRNPWGSEKYKGDYSDDSPLWTKATKEAAGMTAANDGIFFVPIETYHEYVGYS